MQRDRITIRVGDMEDSHIADCVRLLRHQAARYEAEADAAAGYGGTPEGMGAYYVGVAVDENKFNLLWDGNRLIEIFMDELRRRYPNE